MATVRTCKGCKRLFNDYTGRHYCDACLKEEEKTFDKVRDYIRDNPDATIFSTSEACQVSEDKIRQWLKEDRLQYRDPAGAGLYCERCGAPVPSGRFCHDCLLAMSREFGAVLREGQQAKAHIPERKSVSGGGSKMRFLTKRK